MGGYKVCNKQPTLVYYYPLVFTVIYPFRPTSQVMFNAHVYTWMHNQGTTITIIMYVHI